MQNKKRLLTMLERWAIDEKQWTAKAKKENKSESKNKIIDKKRDKNEKK